MNPDAQDKLRAEIMNVLPTVDAPLSQEALNQMPFFKACFKENMRLTPITIGNIRATGKQIVLNGYRIPEMV